MQNWMSVFFSIDQLPFQVSLELLLIAGRAIALIGALSVLAWAFCRWRRSMARDTQRVFEQLDLIQGELHGAVEVVAAITHRLDGLAEKVAATAQLPPVQHPVGSGAYESAIRMVHRGALSEQLASQCGLSRHEADLLVRLHGHATTENAQGTPSDTSVRRKQLAVVG